MFRHIRECWSALSECSTLSEIKATFETFPRWSGSWEATVVGDDEQYVVVTNTYYDNNLENWQEDSEEYEVVIDEEDE